MTLNCLSLTDKDGESENGPHKQVYESVVNGGELDHSSYRLVAITIGRIEYNRIILN